MEEYKVNFLGYDLALLVLVVGIQSLVLFCLRRCQLKRLRSDSVLSGNKMMDVTSERNDEQQTSSSQQQNEEEPIISEKMKTWLDVSVIITTLIIVLLSIITPNVTPFRDFQAWNCIATFFLIISRRMNKLTDVIDRRVIELLAVCNMFSIVVFLSVTFPLMVIGVGTAGVEVWDFGVVCFLFGGYVVLPIWVFVYYFFVSFRPSHYRSFCLCRTTLTLFSGFFVT